MNEQEWLTSTDPQAMLAYIRGQAYDRKIRLFAMACCRLVWDRLTDARGRRAVEVAERYADGEVNEAVRCNAEHGVWRANYNNSWRIPWIPVLPESAIEDPIDIHRLVLRLRHSIPLTTQADLLREICGNPSQPVTFGRGRRCNPYYGSCALDSGHTGQHNANLLRIESAWLTTTVRRLAQVAYAERLPDGRLDPTRLAVLADALEEAGCTEAALLDHLRSPGPHWRGCWAIDLLLAKE